MLFVGDLGEATGDLVGALPKMASTMRITKSTRRAFLLEMDTPAKYGGKRKRHSYLKCGLGFNINCPLFYSFFSLADAEKIHYAYRPGDS